MEQAHNHNENETTSPDSTRSNIPAEDLDQSIMLISKHFGIEQSEFTSQSGVTETSFERLLNEMTRIIRWLLDNDMERLLNGLYRIDVDEEKFKQILFGAPAEKVAENIAILILERELQKVETRRKYSNQ